MKKPIDATRITTKLISAFQTVRETYEANKLEEDFRNREYTDLTHALELMSFGGVGGYKLAKQMQVNRQARRAAKEASELLQPLYDLMERHKEFLTGLKRVQGQIVKTQETQQSRCYSVRARTDMQEAFNKARARQ